MIIHAARTESLLYVLFRNAKISRGKRGALMRMGTWKRGAVWLLAEVLAIALVSSRAACAPVKTCLRAEFQGEVRAGQEWNAVLGQGWVFRIVPIAGYSGWDLVVDRDPPAGYPDALMLATLPYDSINEREIGTTFGLRAQDAIGWNPRSFRFFTGTAQFREAQQRFRQLAAGKASTPAPDNSVAMRRLLQLRESASTGEMRILDARLVPGTRDPKPFAQGWALAFSRTPHEIDPLPPGQAGTDGSLVWMRFALTLWLPDGWKSSPRIHPVRAPCPE